MGIWEPQIGATNEWYTPKYIFEAMRVEFDLDVAAPPTGPRHVPAKSWLSAHSLELNWSGFIWMNPPFGGRNGLMPWLEKFVTHGDGVALTPDRTSAPWFQFIAKRCGYALFLSPKVRFERPDGTLGVSPGTGTTLFAIGPRGEQALISARRLGWLVTQT